MRSKEETDNNFGHVGSEVPNQDPKADFKLALGEMNKERQTFCFS